MLRRVIEGKSFVSYCVASAVWTAAWIWKPFPRDNDLLQLVLIDECAINLDLLKERIRERPEIRNRLRSFRMHAHMVHDHDLSPFGFEIELKGICAAV